METDLNKLRDCTYKCAKENGIHNYTNAQLQMFVITKISAAVEAYRHKKRANINRFFYNTPAVINANMNIYIKQYEENIKDTVEDNLADAIIRLLDIAGVKKIEIDFRKYLGVPPTPDYFNKMTFTDLAYSLCPYLCMNCGDIPPVPEMALNEPLEKLLLWCEYRHIDIFNYIDLKIMYNEQKNIYLK